MSKSRIICLWFSLFIAIMDASAQTFSLSQLQGRVWHAKSGYSLEPLVYWDLSFGGKKCKYIYRPKEINSNAPKRVTTKIDYYLCDSRPLGFDEKQSSTQGTYIAFRQKLTGKKEKKLFFWFAKIKSVDSKVLILEMENETITFESNY